MGPSNQLRRPRLFQPTTRSTIALKTLRRAILLSCIADGVGCHGSVIRTSSGTLGISCPSQPNAATSTDQGVTVDFGNVPIGQTSVLSLQLVSLSSADVTVASVQPGQSSSVFSFPLGSDVTIAPNPPTSLQATFAPTQTGSQNAKWKIQLASGLTVTVLLQGQAFSLDLAAEPNPVDFGNVETHQTNKLPVAVTNRASEAISLTVTLPDAGVFQLLTPPTNASLAAGATLTFDVTYAPLAVESDIAHLAVSGCEGCGATLQIPLLGNGVTALLSYPDTVQFGFVTPLASVRKILALKNIGPSPISIPTAPVLYPGAASAPPGEPVVFAFGPLNPQPSYPYTIAPGNELDLPLVFTPPVIGAYQDATLTFHSSDVRVPQAVVELQGYGGGASISCSPPSLDLSPVAVGTKNSQLLTCVNVGTDIPGYPEAALELSQAQLSTDNPHFSASLQGGIDGGVTLSAGESADLQVTFFAVDAGVELATLEIGSNDLAHDPLPIPLAGRGVIPGPCTANVTPAGGLNFEEVPLGSSASLQFEIQNTGRNYCLVQDLALVSGGDAGFSLPQSDLSNQLLSFLGDPDNAIGLPIGLRVAVQFAPTSQAAALTGSVGFQITTGNPVNRTVALTGSSLPACLTFEPSRVDFGVVGLDEITDSLCFKPHQTILLQNGCSQPITLEALSLDQQLDSTPQFGLTGLPTPPVKLSAGEELAFQVVFSATQAGLKVETLDVTSDESQNPYALSLTGDAEPSGSRTDVFIVPQKQVDLLLALDVDDDGLAEGWDPLSSRTFINQLTPLLQRADDAHVDYRIAVMTGGPKADPDQGWISPCEQCVLSYPPNNAIYVTSQSQPSPSRVLTSLVTAIWSVTPDNTWAEAYKDELFFEIPYQAFDPTLLQGHNAGFLRPNAYLAMLTVNADSEDDQTDLDITTVAKFVQSLKASPNLVSWSYVNGTGISPTPRVDQLVAATGGVEIQMAFVGWQTQLLNFFADTIGAGVFNLGALPDPDSLQVEVDGVSVPSSGTEGTNWAYDTQRNAIVFAEGHIPTPGSTLSISYTLACGSQ